MSKEKSKVKIPCPRCEGKGELPQYHYIKGGICFMCWGKKYIMINMPKDRTEDEVYNAMRNREKNFLKKYRPSKTGEVDEAKEKKVEKKKPAKVVTYVERLTERLEQFTKHLETIKDNEVKNKYDELDQRIYKSVQKGANNPESDEILTLLKAWRKAAWDEKKKRNDKIEEAKKLNDRNTIVKAYESTNIEVFKRGEEVYVFPYGEKDKKYKATITGISHVTGKVKTVDKDGKVHEDYVARIGKLDAVEKEAKQDTEKIELKLDVISKNGINVAAEPEDIVKEIIEKGDISDYLLDHLEIDAVAKKITEGEEKNNIKTNFFINKAHVLADVYDKLGSKEAKLIREHIVEADKNIKMFRNAPIESLAKIKEVTEKNQQIKIERSKAWLNEFMRTGSSHDLNSATFKIQDVDYGKRRLDLIEQVVKERQDEWNEYQNESDEQRQKRKENTAAKRLEEYKEKVSKYDGYQLQQELEATKDTNKVLHLQKLLDELGDDGTIEHIGRKVSIQDGKRVYITRNQPIVLEDYHGRRIVGTVTGISHKNGEFTMRDAATNKRYTSKFYNAKTPTATEITRWKKQTGKKYIPAGKIEPEKKNTNDRILTKEEALQVKDNAEHMTVVGIENSIDEWQKIIDTIDETFPNASIEKRESGKKRYAEKIAIYKKVMEDRLKTKPAANNRNLVFERIEDGKPKWVTIKAGDRVEYISSRMVDQSGKREEVKKTGTVKGISNAKGTIDVIFDGEDMVRDGMDVRSFTPIESKKDEKPVQKKESKDEKKQRLADAKKVQDNSEKFKAQDIGDYHVRLHLHTKTGKEMYIIEPIQKDGDRAEFMKKVNRLKEEMGTKFDRFLKRQYTEYDPTEDLKKMQGISDDKQEEKKEEKPKKNPDDINVTIKNFYNDEIFKDRKKTLDSVKGQMNASEFYKKLYEDYNDGKRIAYWSDLSIDGQIEAVKRIESYDEWSKSMSSSYKWLTNNLPMAMYKRDSAAIEKTNLILEQKEYKDTELGNKVKGLVSKGLKTSKDYEAVGKLIRDELSAMRDGARELGAERRVINDRIEELTQTHRLNDNVANDKTRERNEILANMEDTSDTAKFNEMLKKANKLNDEINGIMDTNGKIILELEELSEKDLALFKQVKEIRQSINGGKVWELMNSVRDFGSVPLQYNKRNRKYSQKDADEMTGFAAKHVPAEWMKAINIWNIDFFNTSDVRSFHSGNAIHMGKKSDDTFLHELMHNVQAKFPSFTENVEMLFYKEHVDLDNKTHLGAGYRADEYYHKRTDGYDWNKNYMGKIYYEKEDGEVRPRSSELLTMGVQELATNPAELMKDEALFDFIVGVLLGV